MGRSRVGSSRMRRSVRRKGPAWASKGSNKAVPNKAPIIHGIGYALRLDERRNGTRLKYNKLPANSD